jgi:hypothetical protein
VTTMEQHSLPVHNFLRKKENRERGNEFKSKQPARHSMPFHAMPYHNNTYTLYTN